MRICKMMASVCLAVTLARTAVAAEAPKPEAYVPPVMDETSKRLLEAWEKKVNNPGRDGVKSITVSIKATFSDTSAAKPYETTGTFKWTHDESGQKTVMAWNNKVLGGVLADLGWPVKAFADCYDKDALKRSLSGTTLAAKPEPASERTIVTISGKTEDNLKQFVFSKDGNLEETKSAMPMADGKMVDVDTKSSGKLEDGRYLETGWSSSYTDPKEGKFDSTVEIKLEKISGFYLWTRVEEKMVRAGKPFGNITLEFSGYKVNDATAK